MTTFFRNWWDAFCDASRYTGYMLADLCRWLVRR